MIFTFFPILIFLLTNDFKIFFTRKILLQLIPEPILYFSPDRPLKNNFIRASQWSSTYIHSLKFLPLEYIGRGLLFKIL